MVMQSHPSGKKGRLGTRFRGKLAAAFGQRNHNASNLWYVYSPRTNSDWVLRSDLEWDHFVLAESDPLIKSVDFNPEPVVGTLDDGVPYRTILDAVVTYVDGTVEWREIKPAASSNGREATRTARQLQAQTAAAIAAGVRYSRWSEIELHANPVRLANWRRAVSWMAGARDYSLALQSTELGGYLRLRTSLTLADLQQLVGDAAFPLFVAAAFRAIQRGDIASDLDQRPLSRNSILRPPGEGQ